MEKRVAIIGGGISGMSAAWALKNKLPDCQVSIFELAARLGGTLQTESDSGYLVDLSADMFTMDPPAALNLCRELGKSDELISTSPVKQRAFVATENGIRPVPRGFSLMLPNDLDAVLNSELIDDQAKQRFLAEEQVFPGDPDTDESLRSFAVRRFGQQVFDRLIQPLASGIYTADPSKLSMKATMSRFVEMEQQHGSLIAAAKSMRRQQRQERAGVSFSDQTASGARYDLFRAPPGGMGQLIDWLQEALTDVEIKTGVEVLAVTEEKGKWKLEFRDDERPEFEAVVLAVRARQAGQLLERANRKLALELNSIETASCAIVILGFDCSNTGIPFDGYGIVVPSCLRRSLIAASFSSNKFVGRASKNRLLARCFFGGALRSQDVELSDGELSAMALAELKRMMHLPTKPEFQKVIRWREAMPQYHLGHVSKVQRIDEQLSQMRGVALAGNSYRGVGIPACIESGLQAAEQVETYLRKPAEQR